MKTCHKALLPLVVVLGLALGGLNSVPAGAEELTFGMSAAFTGPSRALGVEYYRGIMSYFSHVNRRGGVKGRTFGIKAYDDGYNPAPCVRNTIRLIESDAVFGLLNYVGTPTTTRILPILKKFEHEDVYLLFPFTGAEPLRNDPYGRFVFNLRASYFDETQGLVRHFRSIGRDRIAVFYQANAYGRNGWDGVRQGLAAEGLEMAGEAAYKRGSTFDQDYSDAVRIIAEGSPDAVIMVGAYAACAGFIRDARLAGLDVPIASVSFSDADNILNLLGQEEEALSHGLTENLVFSNVVPSYENTTLPAVRLYRSAMDEASPMPPQSLLDGEYEPHRYSFVSFEGFLNGMVLVEMVRRMEGRPERSKIKKAMHSIKQFDIGLREPVRFDPGSNQGLHEVYYSHVLGGRLVPVRDWERWRK